ncbi:hypothetical protein C5167_020678 [Papaver somniferum]|uniref:Uncharacterized protein n=1 Tax=Papaver somniferum TaxID=3469 RepID=A0A4Y7IWT1_PAPSO|nr:hypothetical protein C5167_020678 [Papaver somniferum]
MTLEPIASVCLMPICFQCARQLPWPAPIWRNSSQKPPSRHGVAGTLRLDYNSISEFRCSTNILMQLGRIASRIHR